MSTKVLDEDGVVLLVADVKALADATYVVNVSYDSTNKKIVKTIGQITSDVVSLSDIKEDMDLSDVYGVIISDTAPTSPNVNGWIKTTDPVVNLIPQIDDDAVSPLDTYSSSKINSTYLAYGAAQTLTETQLTQLYANMGFPSNTLGKLGYTVVT